MGIGTADQAELVGVGAKLGFELEAVLQRRARILELEHLGRLRHAGIEIAEVPGLEVGELVIGRQRRMRFAVALGLRRLVEPFPPGALLDIFLVHRLAGEGLDQREHAAVGQVAVVGDRQHVAAGLVLIGLHPLPQVARIVAAERLQRRVGHDLVGLVAHCRGR